MQDEVSLKVKFDRDLVDAITQRPGAREKIRNGNTQFITTIKKLVLNAKSPWRFESLIKACKVLDINSNERVVSFETNDPGLDKEFKKNYLTYFNIKHKHKKANEEANDDIRDTLAGKAPVLKAKVSDRLQELREKRRQARARLEELPIGQQVFGNVGNNYQAYNQPPIPNGLQVMNNAQPALFIPDDDDNDDNGIDF